MIEVLYGYASLANAYGSPEQRHRWMLERIRDKEQNMKSRLERRREAIWARRWWTLFAAVLALVAIPLGIAVIGWAWQLAGRVVLG